MNQYFDMTQVFSSHSHQWGEVLFFVLYVVVIFLIIYRRESNRHATNVAIAMCVIMMIRYFPPIVNFFNLHFFKGHEFARVGWGMLSVPVIAYGAVVVIHEFCETKKKQSFIVIMILLFFLMCSGTQFYFHIPQNYYKLPQEALEVERIIEETTNEKNVGVTFIPREGQTYSKVELVYYGLVGYGKFSYNFVFSDEVSDRAYDVLLTAHGYSQDALIAAGYEKVGETESTIVYKRGEPK